MADAGHRSSSLLELFSRQDENDINSQRPPRRRAFSMSLNKSDPKQEPQKENCSPNTKRIASFDAQRTRNSLQPLQEQVVEGQLASLSPFKKPKRLSYKQRLSRLFERKDVCREDNKQHPCLDTTVEEEPSEIAEKGHDGESPMTSDPQSHMVSLTSALPTSVESEPHGELFSLRIAPTPAPAPAPALPNLSSLSSLKDAEDELPDAQAFLAKIRKDLGGKRAKVAQEVEDFVAKKAESARELRQLVVSLAEKCKTQELEIVHHQTRERCHRHTINFMETHIEAADDLRSKLRNGIETMLEGNGIVKRNKMDKLNTLIKEIEEFNLEVVAKGEECLEKQNAVNQEGRRRSTAVMNSVPFTLEAVPICRSDRDSTIGESELIASLRRELACEREAKNMGHRELQESKCELMNLQNELEAATKQLQASVNLETETTGVQCSLTEDDPDLEEVQLHRQIAEAEKEKAVKEVDFIKQVIDRREVEYSALLEEHEKLQAELSQRAAEKKDGSDAKKKRTKTYAGKSWKGCAEQSDSDSSPMKRRRKSSKRYSMSHSRKQSMDAKPTARTPKSGRHRRLRRNTNGILIRSSLIIPSLKSPMRDTRYVRRAPTMKLGKSPLYRQLTSPVNTKLALARLQQMLHHVQHPSKKEDGTGLPEVASKRLSVASGGRKSGEQHHEPPATKEKLDPVVLIQSVTRGWLTRRKCSDSVRRQIRRNHIVGEILSTERSYVSQLQTIVQAFLNPLKRHVDANVLNVIFGNIPIIVTINALLLKSLELRMQAWSPHQLLADIFLDIAPIFRVYKHYINNFNHAAAFLQQYAKEHPSFVQELKQCEKSDRNTTGLDLKSLLIIPVQRIPRYQLLLSDLVSHTQDYHPDYKNLCTALESVRQLGEYVNESKRQAENLEKIEAIQRCFNDSHIDLIEPHRKYLREGQMSLVYEGSKTGKGVIFLFNDVIALTLHCDKAMGPRTPNRGGLSAPHLHLKMKDMVHLEKTQCQEIEEVEEGQYGLRLLCSSKIFCVYFDSKETRQKWQTAIATATSELLDNFLSRGRSLAFVPENVKELKAKLEKEESHKRDLQSRVETLSDRLNAIDTNYLEAKTGIATADLGMQAVNDEVRSHKLEIQKQMEQEEESKVELINETIHLQERIKQLDSRIDGLKAQTAQYEDELVKTTDEILGHKAILTKTLEELDDEKAVLQQELWRVLTKFSEVEDTMENLASAHEKNSLLHFMLFPNKR